MEGYSRKDESCPQLLDLLQKESKKGVIKMEYEKNHGFPDEKKLELSLGPPGSNCNNFSSSLSSSPWSCYQAKSHQEEQKQKTVFLQNLSVVTVKESLNHCRNISAAEKKGFSQTPPAVPTNTAQKRTAPAPVVGWPPIRSFRKNLASTNTSLKLVSESPNVVVPTNKDSSSKKSIEKGQFVKINMDGIPIGRKVDLKAYDTYEKLSSAVDQLFRGLLAAQNDSSIGKKGNKDEGEKSITGLLDGTGEYTLLYEDNEGDRMLVGNDVPWHMFVSTVKRLRVLKRSELPMLCRGAKHGKISLNS